MKSCFCCKSAIIAIALIAGLIVYFLLAGGTLAFLSGPLFFALTGATAIAVLTAMLLSTTLSPGCPIGCCRLFSILAFLGAVGMLLAVLVALLLPVLAVLALHILISIIVFFLFMMLGGLVAFLSCYNPCNM